MYNINDNLLLMLIKTNNLENNIIENKKQPITTRQEMSTAIDARVITPLRQRPFTLWLIKYITLYLLIRTYLPLCPRRSYRPQVLLLSACNSQRGFYRE